jgi:coenzyme F420-reducing hydrogenase delta subunit
MTEANVEVTRGGTDSVPEGWQPHIVALVCNWCSYAGADMAGTTRLEYPANVRMVRFPCTGRMSPLMILRAFEHGADGVLVSGCHPGDCHYVQGNLVARRRFTIFRSLMDFIGIDLKRLHFAWVSAAEGHKWAKVVSEVTAAVHEAGPLPSFSGPDGWEGLELPEVTGDGPKELEPAQLDAIQSNLRKTASEVLTGGRVVVVVGYGAGTLQNQTIPMLITESADCEKLVWGSGCRNNLSTYLGSVLEKHERVAVVAKNCDLGAISGLIREGQLLREQLLVIGVQCPGVHDESGLATKCLSCSGDPSDL